ncbi:MAG: hypothetical protein GWN99_13660 [Gemmatimonadetes bacterium]|uniref:Uncharacterized protein n=1 Tax=Candidatus Kutchimonas denitrificans TaxID=3056748 RepID=A0AAE4Z9U8_9BACT|nr:hypothetical protein [Gemmatimonadota bacterium]NIR75934.1 hypothetical protein [Candidatus Kutchimonas denitrificans]NIS02092.1 hypothetical protein [Gemmatimonadota bacterium]NIT67917.1 hypothetical protein [Gemmatimonadota bacterium]NIU53911.1 hypothetical protein [Gemmatimonadota bacterium]
MFVSVTAIPLSSFVLAGVLAGVVPTNRTETSAAAEQAAEEPPTIVERLRQCEKAGWIEVEPTTGTYAVLYSSEDDPSVSGNLNLAGVQYEYRATYEEGSPEIPGCGIRTAVQDSEWQKSIRLPGGFRLTAFDDGGGADSATGYIRIDDRVFEAVVFETHTEYAGFEDAPGGEPVPHCPCTETHRIYYSGTIPQRQVSGQITRWMNETSESAASNPGDPIPFKIPYLQIIRPNGGELLETGTEYDVTWQVNHDWILDYGNRVSLCLAAYDERAARIAPKEQVQAGDCFYLSISGWGGFMPLGSVSLDNEEFTWAVANDLEDRFESEPAKYRLFLVVLDHRPPPEPAEGMPGGDWAGLIVHDRSDGFFTLGKQED